MSKTTSQLPGHFYTVSGPDFPSADQLLWAQLVTVFCGEKRTVFTTSHGPL